jgi:hypothetical protein
MHRRVRGVGGSRIGWAIGPAVALGILVVAGAARAQFLVDDFEEDGFVLEASNNGTDLVNHASTKYFDDHRQVYLQGHGEAVSTVVSAPGPGDDALVLTTGGGARVYLTYGSANPDADFSAYAAFEVVVTAAPSAGELDVGFSSPEGTATLKTTFHGPGLYRFELDDMTTTGDFDFAAVHRIHASILASGVAGETFAISEIRIVPEADASGVALGTLLGIAAFARRRAAA